MARPRWLCGAGLSTVLLLAPIAASGQMMNTFESGTTEGWLIHLLGPGAPIGAPPASARPANIATGGPAGANDNFLRLTGTGSGGPGGRVMGINPTWGGNYTTLGVTGIRMNARNSGNSDLFVRFLIEDPFLGPGSTGPDNIAMSAVPILLAAGSGWQTIEFPLFGAQGLTALMGSVAGAMNNVTLVRIFAAPSIVGPGIDAFPPAPMVGVLDLDNIAAVTVPEPSTVALFATGALGILLARRRSTRR